MKRGEIWTVAGGGDYTGKPRPVVILQDDRFDATDSVTICPFTTDPAVLPLFRLPVEATGENGLERPSSIMADKITTVRRSRLQQRLGVLAPRDLSRLEQQVLVFLGFAGRPRAARPRASRAE